MLCPLTKTLFPLVVKFYSIYLSDLYFPFKDKQVKNDKKGSKVHWIIKVEKKEMKSNEKSQKLKNVPKSWYCDRSPFSYFDET